MMPLKKFLKVRDTRPEYEEIKKSGRVGVPCMEFNGKLYFELPEDLEMLKK